MSIDRVDDSRVRDASDSRAWGFCGLTIIAIVLSIVTALPGGELAADSQWYRLLAQGSTNSVIKPYAIRQLGPLLVRAFTGFLHIPTDQGFELLAIFSTIICAGGAAYILHRSGVSSTMFAATCLLPVWATFDHGYLLPDIFFSALLMTFLLCLWRKSYWLAAALLFPLYFSREATLLVLVSLLISGRRVLRLRVLVCACLAAAAGASAALFLARSAPSNVHDLANSTYLLGKVLFNGKRSVWAVWTGLLLVGILPSGHSGGVHLEDRWMLAMPQ